MTNALMTRLAVATLTLLLTACASRPTPVQGDYRLPVLNQPSDRYCSASSRRVIVSELMLSDGILLQRSATQIHAARHHRWSGSLAQQLQQSAQRVLSQPHCEGTVVVRVMDFYGDDDGHAVVSGDWQYRQGDKVMTDTFSYRQPLTDDGYDALVEALNRAWLDSLITIRNAIPN